jgi:NAD(P)-dependent dehydrogenase (short-subunit alcohol dehydrogenase family)
MPQQSDADFIRYEAQPTRMFGAYKVVAINHAGIESDVSHGDPQSCLAQAAALNASLASKQPNQSEFPRAFDRFGLPAERWAALAGQVFWIVGGGTGYGRALACALVAAGATVALTGRRAAKLAETAEAINAIWDKADIIQVPADITDPMATASVAGKIITVAGRLDGAVCCAALPQAGNGGLLNIDLSSLRAMIDANVTGQLHVARAAISAMRARQRYRLVFLTSEAGWAFTPGFGPYNLTKAALNNLGASLAAELQSLEPTSDVQINIVSPGEARTEMNQRSDQDPICLADIVLALLSHPAGGPNGKFFHRDGRHLEFAYATAWGHPLLGPSHAENQRRTGSSVMQWLRKQL